MRRLSTGELLCIPFLDTDITTDLILADSELDRRGYPRWLVAFLRRVCGIGLWHQAIVWEEWHLDLADVAIGYSPILMGTGAFLAVVGHLLGRWAEIAGITIAASGIGLLGLAIVSVRFRRIKTPAVPLHDWYAVTFDDECVTMTAKPPGRDSWEQSFRWSEVERVCFKSEGALASDGIYIFTTQRPESFVVPTEAKGGVEFWSEILERRLFSSDLAIKAATLTGGEILCWPAIHS
jgi:hypothetical protein